MITLQNLYKKFNKLQALNNISLDVEPGELIALLGESGSGKTTLLRVIAGLEKQDSGSIMINGIDISSLPPRQRRIGFVFQNYALFKHMTVFENIAFGLRILSAATKPSEEEIKQKVMSLLKLLHMEDFAQYHPEQLSGGQKQRIAIARAIATEQNILLLDEPFGALDSRVRKELRGWLRKLHDHSPITSILVTHDLEEAMEVADRIAVMSKGKIIQMGTAAELYNKPANEFIYNFFGDSNIFEGYKNRHGQIIITEDNSALVKEDSDKLPTMPLKTFFPLLSWFKNIFATWLKPFKFDYRLTSLSLFKAKKLMLIDSQTNPEYVKIYCRPHDIAVFSHFQTGKHNIKVRLVRINIMGKIAKLETIRPNDDLILIELAQQFVENAKLVKGQTLYLHPNNFTIFANNS